MRPISRRAFLAAAAAPLAAGPARAIPPLERVNPRITGLGLTAYSLKPHMKWWQGKETAGKLTVPDFLDYCAKLGLEAAELTSYFFEAPVKREQLAEIKRRAHLLGLHVSGGAMANNFTHPPGSDEAKRQLEYCRTWVDHFAEIGAAVVRVFAGNPAKGVAVDDAVKNVLANLGEALPYAEKRGVMLGMENHDLVKNIDLLEKIVKAVDSRWFGVIWDSANLAPTPDPYADLARIAPYALVAQAKVMTRVNGKDVPADFGKLVKILRDAKFAGPLVFEYEEKEDPFDAIPRYVKQLREALRT
ncbi:MAG: sugar phosphate isomerase/epimerase [Planctomycetes bacterium]|nr:sugar phosphate isomerase/epimerase [Planctomycetota bacterium]